ncbi:MAG: hypothetical protein ABI662_03520 [Dermatophilaceae bacterium]
MGLDDVIRSVARIAAPPSRAGSPEMAGSLGYTPATNVAERYL